MIYNIFTHNISKHNFMFFYIELQSILQVYNYYKKITQKKTANIIHLIYTKKEHSLML